jgi:hypothetical protein
MTIQTTGYKPDTCDCVLQLIWDDTLPEDSRITTPNYVVVCQPHSVLANDTDRWNTLVEENHRKNDAFNEILKNGPASLSETKEGALVLKDEITFSFAWNGTAPNRILEISFSGVLLSSPENDQIQTSLDSKLGAGKVVLV